MLLMRLNLLGNFHASVEGEPLAAINTTRLRSLIAYLLLRRDVAHTRQQLAYLLWPDSTDAQARTNLRKLLLQLRQSSPAIAACLRETGQSLQWLVDAPVVVDLVEFERAIVDGSYERAISLYTGDLLLDCDDEWIAVERERLRQLFVGALERHIAILEGKRDYRNAIALSQKLLQHDLLNEAAYRRLMRLYALNGNRAAALQVYQTCQQTLKCELGVEPEDDTRECYARLLRVNSIAHEHGQEISQRTVLVGRVAQWQQMLSIWNSTLSKPQCVIVAGEAGIGKTRLAEELLTWANDQGIAIATARCYAAEGALAYAPVIDWLRSDGIRKSLTTLDNIWLTEVARLLPELLAENSKLPRPGPLAEGWHRQRLFEALARAVLSTDEPLILLLDDAQWSDRDTIEWLAFLIRFKVRTRLMLIITVRSDEVCDDHPLRAFQAQAQRESHVTQIELDPLNATETGALATEIANQVPPPDRLAHLYRETEGNPLFVVEMMRSQSIGLPSDRHEAIPSNIQAVITHRLNQLTSDARDVTGLAATIGREFTFNVLAKASSQSNDCLVNNLDELLRRRIIREHISSAGHSTYDFSHDKIREAAYRGLSHARRQLYHCHVAEALEKIYATTLNVVCGQIAAHYDQAGHIEQAIDYYQRAAQTAQSIYANAEAIRYYRRAQTLLDGLIEQAPDLAATSPNLNESLGDVLHYTTQYVDALAAYRQALACSKQLDWHQIARLHRKIGNTLRDQRDYASAERAYACAIDSLPDPECSDTTSDARQEWIQVQVEIDSLHYWQGRLAESNGLLERLQPMVERYGTPSQRAEFFRSLAYKLFRQNRSVSTDKIVAYTQVTLDAFVAMGDQIHIPSAMFGFGFMLLWHGKPEQAESLILEALHIAERTGDTSLVARCVTYLSVVYRQLGQVEQTDQFARRSRTAADSAHMPEYTALAEANAAWVAWCNGDWNGILTHGQAAIAFWNQLPVGHASTPFQWTALCPLIAAALHAGDIATATDYARLLLNPNLQRLPDGLTMVLEQAIQEWNVHQTKAARAWLDEAITLARQLHLL